MREAFLSKAEEVGGVTRAHAPSRALAPGAKEPISGVLVVTERGLVFVEDELFEAGTPTLIERGDVLRVTRNEGPWGTELVVDTRVGTWTFTRIESSAADALSSALSLGEQGASETPSSTQYSCSTASGAPQSREQSTEAGFTANDAPGRTGGHGSDELVAPAEFGARAVTRAASAIPWRLVVAPLLVLSVAGVVFLTLLSEAAPPGRREAPRAVVESATDPQTAIAAGATLSAGRAVYAPGEAIEIRYAGFPGNAQDWVTVVPKDAADDHYEEWTYLQSQRQGTARFRGLEPGSYEARAYYDWPEGGYRVQHRVPFRVEAR